MISCKNCGSARTVKNGKVRNKQRYRCKNCGLNFVEGDSRHSREVKLKKALFLLLQRLGHTPLQPTADILNTWPSQLCRWASGIKGDNEEAKRNAVRILSRETLQSFLDQYVTQQQANRFLVAQGSLGEGSSITVIVHNHMECSPK